MMNSFTMSKLPTKLVYLLLLLPACLKAQEPALKKIELLTGFSLSRPLGINKQITFQSGIVGEIGIRYNFHLGKDNYVNAGVDYGTHAYSIEGYFIESNGDDKFIITPDNVKVNTLAIDPISLNLGFKKLFNRGVLGIDLATQYNNKVTRKYKIGSNKFDEKYSLNRKINFAIDGIVGLIFSPPKKFRLDLVFGYSFSSIGKASHFNPLTSGIRLVQSFGK